ncbi:Hydroxypyruvate reductase [Sporomusa carbonis]|uniref:phosphoglycerate dehydrogenase n=1 Tax=Sporomusa carbonis TaxID=3076075 RepID=UPI003A63F74D
MAVILTTPRSFAGCKKALELLQQAGHEVRVQKPEKPYAAKELCSVIQGVDAIIAGLDEINSEVIQAGSPTLKIIARNGAGYNNVDIEAARRHNVVVTVTPGANSIAVCELAFALMIGLSRKIHVMDAYIRDGQWTRVPGVELFGKTVGVIGTGAIGSELIKRCVAFGMKVLAYDLYPNQGLIDNYGVKYTELEQIYQESDYLSLHLPSSAQTQGMINADVISRMKKGACLINTARGDLIDENALFAALESGHLGGAGLDAFVHEPFTDERFFKLSNVIMTPHSGSYTAESVERTLVAAAEEVLRVLSNQKPLHAVG